MLESTENSTSQTAPRRTNMAVADYNPQHLSSPHVLTHLNTDEAY